MIYIIIWVSGGVMALSVIMGIWEVIWHRNLRKQQDQDHAAYIFKQLYDGKINHREFIQSFKEMENKK